MFDPNQYAPIIGIVGLMSYAIRRLERLADKKQNGGNTISATGVKGMEGLQSDYGHLSEEVAELRDRQDNLTEGHTRLSVKVAIIQGRLGIPNGD